MEWLEYVQYWMDFFYKEIIYFSYGILVLGIIQNVTYLIQLPLAAMALFRARLRTQDDHTWWLVTSNITLPISIIIPAYNEELILSKVIVSTMATQYPSFDIIVVNDGSTDNTLKLLIKRFKLKKTERWYEESLPHKVIKGIYTSPSYANLIVVDKENGGRSDALNAGIDISRHPILCTLDADSLLDSSALLKTIQPFLEKPDTMMATGGTVRILNGCEIKNSIIKKVRLSKKILPLFQVVEYIRAFLMGRLAWSYVGILTIISGAFAIFKRDMVIKVGGFDKKTIGEDSDLVVKIHEYCRFHKIDYEVRFVPEPVCWTEVPETIAVLGNQRIRWQQGGLEVFFNHIKMLMNPRYGRIGLLAYPLMFIFDVLGPLAELIGYIFIPIFYAFGGLDIDFMIAFFCLFFVFGIFISTMSLVLEELSLKRFIDIKDLLLLGFIAIIENFGYRQINNIWRLVGWWRFIRKKQVWGEMKRTGVQEQ